jgi:hypothetical protein
MLKQFAVAAVAALSIGSALAAPNTYRNEKWGFNAVYPAGWIVGEMNQGALAVTAVAPPPEVGVTCNTTAESIAMTKKMTQSEINKQNSEPFPPQFWLTTVYSRFADIAIERSGQRIHPSGIAVQESIAAFNTVEGGQTFRAKAQTTIFITPGTTFSMTCITLESKFEKYRKDFAATIDSFRKGRGDLSADANAAAPSVVNVLNLELTSLASGAAEGLATAKLR